MSKREIPESWALDSLSGLCEFIRNGISAKQTKVPPGDPLSRIETISSGHIDFTKIGFAKIPEIKKNQYRLLGGDILLSHINSFEHIGKSAIFNSDQVLYHGMNLLCLRPKDLIDSKFLANYLKSNLARDYFKSKCKRAINQVSINTKDVGDLQVPIPPVSEQRRIVSKIEATKERVQAIEASISKADELIEKYREALLQKAFRGELVPQDPKDEPASKLIERIRAEKEKQSDGKKKKKDELPSIKPEEIPFEIPSSWLWLRLGDLISVSSGDGLTAKEQKGGSIPVFGGNGVAGYHSQANINLSSIIIGRVGAKCGVVHVTPDKAWVTDNALIVKPKLDVDKKWLAEALSWLNLNADANRSAQPVISGSKIYPRLIPLPPRDEQVRIVSKIQSQLVSIESLKQTKSKIAEICAVISESILESAFSGNLVRQEISEGTGHDLIDRVKTELQQNVGSKEPKLISTFSKNKRAKK